MKPFGPGHSHATTSGPDPARPPVPPVIPDHELLRKIGGGAYGEVWLARNVLGTLRAVKIVYRRDFTEAHPFEREFKGIQKYEPISRSHDGLVDILQIGRDDSAGHFYYVMELADGAQTERSNGESECWSDAKNQVASDPAIHHSNTPRLQSPNSYTPRTLRSDLKTQGRLPPAECATLGLKLAAALEYLHTQGLVHRDIKPSNIIFVAGVPKLADIGLVSAIDDAHSLVGTVGYIPPEGPGTPQADLYSLGKVLYEITFGKERQEFPQLPPDLELHPDYAALLELNEVILKACESDPRKRYQSARQMHDELLLLQRGKSVKHKRAAEQRWAWTKKLALSGAVLALLVTALAFLNASKPGHTPTPEAEGEYRLGKFFYDQCTPQAHRKALEHLRRALELDPKYVKPYGELTAICVWGRPGVFASGEAKIHLTKEIADKLLASAPGSAERHTALSWCRFMEHDWRGAEAEIVRAIELNPNYPIARDIYVYYLSMLGRTDEAQRQAKRSQKLDNTGRISAVVAAWPFITARQFDKAIAQLKKAIELEPDFPEAHNILGVCYQAQSNYVDAIKESRTYDLLLRHDDPRVLASYAALGRAFEEHGQEGYLRKMIELIRENESLPEAEQIFSAQDIAGYYARLGEKEKALKALEEHFDHTLKFDPMLDTLHDEPRFKALLKRYGLGE